MKNISLWEVMRLKHYTPILLAISITYLFILTFPNISCNKKDGKVVAIKSINRKVIKPPVTTINIVPQDVVYVLEAVGSLEADTVSIPAKVNGVITNIFFKEGDYVEKNNTILAEIDPLYYELELQKAKTQVETARAQIKIMLARERQSKALYKKAEIDYKKRRELYKKNIVTFEELLSFQTIYKQALANMQEIRASIEQSRANLNQMKILYKLAHKNYIESKAISPVTGIIQSKNITLSQYVRPDMVIATIVDINSLYVKFNIPQSDANRLYIGQKVKFSNTAEPIKPSTAVIYYISQYANPKTRMVEVRANNIMFPEEVSKKNLLKAGYFVNVFIDTDIHKNALVVPQQAIITTEYGNIVFVLEGNIAKARKVEIGLSTKDEKVEILSGIKADDIVVVSGANVLQDGMEVEVVK